MNREDPADTFSVTLTVDTLKLTSGNDDQEFAYLPRPDDGLWHQFAMIYSSMTILLDGDVVLGGATVTVPILSSGSSYK